MNNKNLLTAILLLPFVALAALLTGCGGSGSKPSEVEVGAYGYSETTRTASSGTTVTTTDELGGLYYPGIELTVRSDNTIRKLSMSGKVGHVSWDENAGDVIDESTILIAASNPSETKFGFFIDGGDPSLAWNYQTYGVWVDGFGEASGNYGAITVGDYTLGSDVPTSGSASFAGLSNGVYVDSSGQMYIATSAVSLNADFTTRSIGFSTSGTQKTEVSPAATSSTATNLDMSGTLTYSAGSAHFVGSVTTSTLSGTADGNFYGPNAEEAGGAFTLTGTGVESYTGAFGAKR